MKFSLIATAAALVASSLSAPTTDNTIVVRESHLVDTKVHDGTVDVKVDLVNPADDDDKPKEGHTATTNVKRSTSKKEASKEKASKPKKKLAKATIKTSTKSTTTGFKNGDDLIGSLTSLVSSVANSGDKINATLLRVQAGKETQSKGISDSAKQLVQVRAALSGALTRLSTTRDLNLTSSEREEVGELVETLVQDLLSIVNDLIDTLGLKLTVTASINNLINMLTNLLGGLAVSDSKLSPELHDRLDSIIRAEINNNGDGNLDAILSGLVNPLFRLLGGLKASSKSN
ncbi:hypothetical protein NW762_008175 [Fusarium torreyae]|uniref:Uncharacterized protein n=1 Tax=Fusarium torreyae TaxID=1237075 RepID=A0A9W8VDF6_9HYPO|nr:hypothetical protein NW762_008175 [Fusarium torreyae]